MQFLYKEGDMYVFMDTGNYDQVQITEDMLEAAKPYLGFTFAETISALHPYYVLRALGVGTELAHSSIRFGLGRFNTDEEVDYVAELVIRSVERLREMSPLYEMVKEGMDLSKMQWVTH